MFGFDAFSHYRRFTYMQLFKFEPQGEIQQNETLIRIKRTSGKSHATHISFRRAYNITDRCENKINIPFEINLNNSSFFLLKNVLAPYRGEYEIDEHC